LEKNRAIKRFLAKLPFLLQRRYGPGDFYTIGQVERTLKDENIPIAYFGYALAIFLCTENAVDALVNTDIYNSLKKEVADRYFDGDISFKIQDIKLSKVGNEVTIQ
jgi:hypothetical protein